ncbi:type II toxin-antitoxin system Phd/YefM family antitoxin, partial [Candidatus Berkelbacteria bacterium]|nr:type II toxin-antitoxin system Phd/YefM family antitoxin [Candidatus Berkelbacteria bacterium]
MLEVEINKILPLTEARDNFSKIVGEVEQGELYVLTKNGKPAVAIINVAKLEEMTGQHLKERAKSQVPISKQEPISNVQPKVPLPP